MAYQHVGTWSFESFIHIETLDLASDVLVVFHKVRRATVCVLFGCLVFHSNCIVILFSKYELVIGSEFCCCYGGVLTLENIDSHVDQTRTWTPITMMDPSIPDRQHDHCPSLGPRNLTFFLWLLLMVLAPLMQFLLLDVCKCYPSDPFQCNWIFFAFLSIMQVTSQTLRGPLGQYQMVSSSPRIDLLFKHLIFNSFLDFFSLVFWGS